jgi:hypothetical protein
MARGVILPFANMPAVPIWMVLGQGRRVLRQYRDRCHLLSRMMATLLVMSMLPMVSGH